LFDLLPFYAILRSIPNKLLGVISMFVAILILLILPFTDTSNIKGSSYKPLYIIAFWIFSLNFLVLMWLGSCHVEPVRHLIFTDRSVKHTHHFSKYMMTIQELGKAERVLLNIAFLEIVLFKIKAILLELNHSLFLNMGRFILIYIQTSKIRRLDLTYGESDTNSEKSEVRMRV